VANPRGGIRNHERTRDGNGLYDEYRDDENRSEYLQLAYSIGCGYRHNRRYIHVVEEVCCEESLHGWNVLHLVPNFLQLTIPLHQNFVGKIAGTGRCRTWKPA